MADKNFLGIPIEGEVAAGDRRVAQRPLEDFQPLVQAVLDDETVAKIQWTQYTPYFNDGDPCVFSANGVYVLPAGVEDDMEGDDFDGYSAEDSNAWIGVDYAYGDHAVAFLGTVKYHWEGTWPDRQYVLDSYEGPDRERYNRLKALSDAVNGGEFDHVLQDLFGDHCTVTISREKIVVEEYSHD